MKKIAIAFIFMLIFIGGLKLESSAVTAQCGMCKKNVHTSCSKMKYESKGGSTHVNTCCCGSTWYDGCSSWKWSSSSHIKTCGLCGGTVSHTADFKYYDSSKEICDYGGCLVKRDHSLSSYKDGGTYHYKTCSRSRCSGYIFKKGDHTGGTATCTAKAICDTCKLEYGSLAAHVESSWSISNGKHIKICVNCKTTISEHNPDFKYSSATQEKCSKCTLIQGHSLSGWLDGGTYHYKTCSRCSERTFEKGDHTGGKQTCTQGAVCSTCTVTYKAALGHTGGTPECEGTGKKAVCTRCSSSYGNLVDHNYSTKCTVKHCTGYVCKWCGKHNGTCNGGCNSTKCTHCGYQFCSRCETHTAKVSCPCDTKMSCSDKHCAGIKWCSMCGSHTHVGCNTNSTCPQPHCSQKICSVCGGNHQGTCGGGHKYSWITNTTSSQTQTHTNKCYVTADCTATNGSHSAIWGRANISHTSTCTKCSLTYTHPVQWSTAQRTATEKHPCAWSGGCTATHDPAWGAYYKVNGGKDGDTDGSSHTRKCSTCGITEKYHSYTDEAWSWLNTTNHIRKCKVCNLSQASKHTFTKSKAKDEDSTNHTELYKHWQICTTCDPNLTHKEVDELHEDNGNGVCIKCGQILWKAIEVKAGEDITDKIQDEESSRKRAATNEEKIKIIEVVDNNGSPKIQYIQKLSGEDDEVVASSNILTIVENGEYDFITGRGGTVTIIILNISKEILIDKIIDPITSTTEKVTIIIRTNKAEEQYEKDIYIKEGNSKVSDSELANGDNPYEITKEVEQNGEYYFSARDTAGNEKIIKVVIDNIIKGQTTVAISNDVFRRGYVFTEILVNPNKSWSATGNAKDIVKAAKYKIGSTSPQALDNDDIKIVKVMDMQRNEVKKDSNMYLPGAYYIQVAIGGKIFDSAGTYIVDLENVNLTGGVSLAGKNRIIVEVQDLKDLT